MEQLDDIRRELGRIRATHLDVGGADAIGVRDMGEGYVHLTGAPGGPREYLVGCGEATAVLERLKGLPTGSGPEAIRSEFA